jgi:RNA polymerase sigma-70 factor (ECF subfamily)
MHDSTYWTVIPAAARGDPVGREDFARRYDRPVRAYLAARWAGGPHRQDVEDAVQEVFVECFRQGGALERVEAGRPGGFRAFLYGLVRNVARSFERRHAAERRRVGGPVEGDQVAAEESSLSVVFDRSWARAIMHQAGRRQQELAEQAGEEALRRVELLRLRFQEDKPIRDIAALWHADADHLHREYVRARQEFRAALSEVVAFHHPGPPAEVERECRQLLELLQAK